MPDPKSPANVHRCTIKNLPLEHGVLGEITVEGENAAQCIDQIVRLLKRKSRPRKSGRCSPPPTSPTDFLETAIERYISDLMRWKVGLTYIQLHRQTLGIMLAVTGNK